MSDEELKVPSVGTEVLVRFTLPVSSDQYWRQYGNLLEVRADPIGLVVGTVEITRLMTAENNPRGGPGDKWTGCIVNAVFNPFSDDWRATRPVSDRAKEVWYTVWEEERDNNQ